MASATSEQIAGIEYAKTAADVPCLEVVDRLRTPLCLTADGRPTFVLSKYPTTAAFLEATQQWSEQSVTCIFDPLGINGETMIGQRRAERPLTTPRSALRASLETDAFKHLFPIFARPENEWLLIALIEGIDSPSLLHWLYTELDTIPDKPRADHLKRKILLNPALPDEILSNSCVFCNVKQFQVMDSLGEPRTAIAIHNDLPFGPLMHKLLILQQRKHNISEIASEDVFNLYQLLHSIAIRGRNKYGADFDGLTYGMNYGLSRIHKRTEIIAPAASQPHLHCQVSAITKTSFNAADRIGLMCNAYRRHHGRDYLEDYLSALQDANLVLRENDHAVLYVPIAQRFNYEVQIMAKSAEVGNILDTSPAVRRSFGCLEHLAYQIYQHPELNIQSFNTVLYSTRFSQEHEDRYRLILSIYPRTTIIALSELVQRNVVDSFPWQAAAKLRACMEDVLSRGPRRISVLAVGAHPDDIELGCGGTILELTKRRHEVHALVITDGCGGAERDPVTREKETNNAARVLGVSSVAFGRIRDGQAHLTDAVFNVVKAQIDRHHPDLILFHANIGSEHSDHKNVSEAVKTVCARLKPRLKGLMFEGPSYKADMSFKPNIYVNIAASIEAKKKAVSQHKSEIDRAAITLDQVEQRARLRAGEISPEVSHAEAFAVEPADVDTSQMVKLLPFVFTT